MSISSSAASTADDAQDFVNALTTNLTRFWREEHHFEHLIGYVGELMKTRTSQSSKRLRIWSAGCSTGQEPYTIALCLLAALPELKRWDFKILATDIDTAVIAKAATAVYPEAELNGLSPERVRLFERMGDGRIRVPQAVASTGLVQAAQSDGAVADEGAVRRHLLPQRRDLFRQADAGRSVRPARQDPGARRLSLYRPFGKSGHGRQRVSGSSARPSISPALRAGEGTQHEHQGSGRRRFRADPRGADAAPSGAMATSRWSAPPSDPIDARSKIKTLNPDVVTLDIEMPNMNGLAFLDKLMRLHPLPVVMVSTLTTKGASETLLALELGAVDFVAKPSTDLAGGLEAFGANLREKVRAAATSDVRGARREAGASGQASHGRGARRAR